MGHLRLQNGSLIFFRKFLGTQQEFKKIVVVDVRQLFFCIRTFSFVKCDTIENEPLPFAGLSAWIGVTTFGSNRE